MSFKSCRDSVTLPGPRAATASQTLIYGPLTPRIARAETSWTGYSLCTPFATDFGPGPEAAAQGRPKRRAGPAEAAQEEHLLLLRITTASGLLLDIHSFRFVSVYFWSQNVRRLDDSLLPRHLWRAGRRMRGKRGPRCCFYHPPWQQLGWRLGWKDCSGCCCWLWLDLLAISRTLLSVAVSGVMLPTVRDLAGKKTKQAMKEVALHPPLSAGPAGGRPYGSGTGGAPAATPLAANALYASRRRLRAWPGAAEAGSAGLGVCFLRFSPPTSGQALRRRQRGVQLDRESLCTPLAADFGPGPEGAAKGCSAGRGVCSPRLSPPTSGLARRGRRRGAQLDGEFALHASRHRLRAWPGVGGGGALSWTGSLLLRLSPSTSGPSKSCPVGNM